MDLAVRGPVGPAGMRHLERALVRSQAAMGARGLDIGARLVGEYPGMCAEGDFRVAPRCAWLDGRGERILMNMVEIVLSILRFAGVYLLAYLGQ